MLAPGLPRLPYLNEQTCRFQAQCLAFAMLAYYNTVDFVGRVLTSFQRSYDVTDIRRTQRSTAGRPGFITAIFRGDTNQKIIVAIEGTTSPSQLLAYCREFRSEQMRENGPWTYGVFAEYAKQIIALLDLDPLWVEARSIRGVDVVFTGHSLGAAIAKVLAEHYSNVYRTLNVRYCAFASPRVTIPRTDSIPSPHQIGVDVYTEQDAIRNFPFANDGTKRSWNGSNSLGLQFFDAPLRARMWDQNGYEMGYGLYQLPTSGPDALRQLSRASLAATMFFQHEIKYYRNMMSNVLFRYNDEDLARFNFIELPDNNAWGYRWRDRTAVDSTWLVDMPSTPADQDVRVGGRIITGGTPPVVVSRPQPSVTAPTPQSARDRIVPINNSTSRLRRIGVGVGPR